MNGRKMTPGTTNITRLSDQGLLKGGLRPVRAFIRVDQTDGHHVNDDVSPDDVSAPETNAERQKTHKEKRKEEGFRQMNVELPDDDKARSAIKELSKGLVEGRFDIRQLEDLLKPDPVVAGTLNRCRDALEKGGIRGWVIKTLAG